MTWRTHFSESGYFMSFISEGGNTYPRIQILPSCNTLKLFTPSNYFYFQFYVELRPPSTGTRKVIARVVDLLHFDLCGGGYMASGRGCKVVNIASNIVNTAVKQSGLASHKHIPSYFNSHIFERLLLVNKVNGLILAQPYSK